VLGSKASECKAGRAVKVFEEKGKKDPTVGTAITNRKGKWKEPFPNADGKYYAKTGKANQVAENGDKIVCGPATSKTITAKS
jgi:hypothetical protein